MKLNPNKKLFMKNVSSIEGDNKRKKFHHALTLDSYDFLAFTETWLTHEIKSSDFIPPNYAGNRLDRNDANRNGKKKGGGVLILYKGQQQAKRICSHKSIEAVASKIRLDDNKCLFLVSSYLPRTRVTAKQDEDCQRHHLSLYKKIIRMASPNDLIMICGDFNMKQVKWVRNDDHMIPTNLEKGKVPPRFKRFIEAMNKMGLKQINPIENDNHRLLDLVFTNKSNVCSVSQPTEVFTCDTEKHHKGTIVEFRTDF